ncbi:PAL-domain-containing protein [Laetiporus sulphureus 93-53]|uniref:PAL-domain-containing protein n=1 Tax=Laetiporus sulphureus 93-53 TaxID=1314785 RepID=A0A165B6V4_9APHY|nr:PAL-domain-containing protein [Laetiporus sulphureus 93-53]KZT00379.1 PAL-domain-containing protein [Laetiporus sulphureus 93-53]
MPESWVRGAIAIRINALIRGHSGCRWVVIDALQKLLAANVIPCPPLRQTISASGDLGPLAYIASALTGDRDCAVWDGEGKDRRIISSSVALERHAISAIEFLPKEGLAVVNGTAPSCSVSALAIHDAHFLLLLSQATTAMCVEALLGALESFHPFLHDVARPHPGQIEVAANIRRALAQSRLVTQHVEGKAGDRLRQDRYSLRTAPQWIGPQVEELLSSHQTILTEINSTTDNPILDASNGRTTSFSGGNFQGTSLTIAMEKTRIALQHVGAIAYAQMVELGSPHMSRGLAPDVAANEPSIDYGQKAMDMACASYLAELSFISSTVSNHVQPAEMHNQSVNSLALISARYTMTAVQLTQMIMANLLLSLCQAVDLRAMYKCFFDKLDGHIRTSLLATIQPALSPLKVQEMTTLLRQQAEGSFRETGTLDSGERFYVMCKPLVADVSSYLSTLTQEPNAFEQRHFDAHTFHVQLAASLSDAWISNRSSFFDNGSAEELLGVGTRQLYRWVRQDLGVRMRRGIDFDEEGTDAVVSRIYAAIVQGDVNNVLVKMFRDGDLELSV